MSLKKQALSGMFWSSMQLFGTQAIGFGVSMILARLLLRAKFALIAMFGIFMVLATVLINSGLTVSLMRTQDLDEEDFSTIFFFNLAGSIVIYFIIFKGAPLIASFYKQSLLTMITRIYGVTFIINAFFTKQIVRLTKMMDLKTQLQFRVPSLIRHSVVGITMAYNGYGV